MQFRDYFAPDYRAARAGFLAACRAAGARIETFENPAAAPDGAPVHTDVGLIGTADADRALLVNSATHGVEGFCGSGALVGWLRSGAYRDLAANVRVVLIHAINPHGFAWLRRVTEDNVDLNRNFVDHDRARPRNPEYTELHPLLAPERWDEESRAALRNRLDAYAREHGEFAAQSVITRGQYDHSDGVFYGGRAPGWSNRTFRDILDRFVKGAAKVCFLDFHTGLGPYGAAELIAAARPGTAAGDRLIAWFGDGITSPEAGTSSSAALTGTIAGAVRRTLAGTEITSVTVEFGTYPVRPVLLALLADNWLHLRGDVDSPLGRAIKAEIRKRLYPDEDDWKELVWSRSRQILDRAVRGLSAA